jgi:predicted GNAT family acetyltransferase
MSDAVHVTDNPGRNRYEAHLDGVLAGFAEYQLADQLIVFTHTEVDRAHEGKGVGSALARFALDDVRDHGGRRVLALCPFIKAWVLRHPAYADLLYDRPSSVVHD